jgi:undecaprenyl-phosphate 4-deoxy-4-formamido-L-arabinose transferase
MPQDFLKLTNLASVSVVVPVFNSQSTLRELVQRIQEALGDRCCEVILVDDASRDESWETILAICSEIDIVGGIQLMQNSGQHAALIAGIREASGDIIVTLDDDLQHPPFQIPKLIESLDQYTDLVYGIPERVSQSTIRKITSFFARFVLRRVFGVQHAHSYTSFRAFRSSVKVGLEGYVGERPSIDPLLSWVTNRVSFVKVEHHRRISGASNYSFRSLRRFFGDSILTYSEIPLLLAVRVGFLTSFMGLSSAIFFTTRTILFGSTVPGFPLLASSITFLAGLQIGLIGVVGRYIGKIHFRIMNKPTYIVRARTL